MIALNPLSMVEMMAAATHKVQFYVFFSPTDNVLSVLCFVAAVFFFTLRLLFLPPHFLLRFTFFSLLSCFFLFGFSFLIFPPSAYYLLVTTYSLCLCISWTVTFFYTLSSLFGFSVMISNVGYRTIFLRCCWLLIRWHSIGVNMLT